MKSIPLGITAIATLVSVANAQLAATFGFTDMGANWSNFDNELNINASASIILNTSGDLTNYLGTPFPSTALFDSNTGGFVHSYSSFEMVLSNITASSADADGNFIITDIDGDTLSGSYSGQWTNQFGFGFFNGQITEASYNAVGSGDGIFEGNAGQSFAVPTQSLAGGLSMLLQMPLWFDDSNSNFNGRSAQLDGILVVPTPGSMALLGMGGLLATRRRR